MAMAIAALALSTASHAQWINERTAGIPRLADGQPNLSAPTPRTADGKPDFSGIWIATPDSAYLMNIAADLQPADVQLAPNADANPFRYRTMTISLVDGQLYADFNGKGHVLLAPISDTCSRPVCSAPSSSSATRAGRLRT
jgi:hypothetical protein